MARSTFLPLQHTATLISSVDWGSDIVIDEMVLAWYAFFDNGEVGRHVQTLSNGAATSAEFSIGEYSELTPYAVGVYAYLIPDDIEYGGGWYQNWAWTYLGQ